MDKLIMIGQGKIALLDPKDTKKNIFDDDIITEQLFELMQECPNIKRTLVSAAMMVLSKEQ